MIAPRRPTRPRVVHGGPRGARDRDRPPALDFSTNVNAWGPAPTVLRALRELDPAPYPDPDASAPREAAGFLWRIGPERVVFGAGATDLIHTLTRTYLRPGDRALVANPAFGEYALAAELAGAEVCGVGTRGVAADPSCDDLVAAIEATRPRLVFVASPSSPLGVNRPVHELGRLADATSPFGLLVLDESYRSFADLRLSGPTLPEHDTVVHVRSVTKDCALAGLRAGFLVAPTDVCSALEALRPAWNTGAPAQAAAAAALSPEGVAYTEGTLVRLADERVRLARALTLEDLAVCPSSTNYLCARAPDTPALATTLERVGIRVRDCASFGLAGYVRVAVRTPEEDDRLVRAVREALGRC